MNKRTRALIGATGVSVVVAATALTGGTSAFFYQVETNTENGIESCAFDIDPTTTVTLTPYDVASSQMSNEVDEAVTQSQINVANMQPGDAFTAKIELTNIGDCAADLWTDINFPLNFQEGPVAGETPAEAASRALRAEFANYLDVTVTSIAGVAAGALPATPVTGATASFYDLAFDAAGMPQSALPGGSTHTLLVTVLFPDTGDRGAENRFMGLPLTFTTDYALSQVGINPGGSLTGLDAPVVVAP